MINSANNLNAKLAIDVKDVGDLRQAARQNSPEALKGAASQFEALFMNMMLKSMREATPQGNLLGGDQERMYTSMLDQQLSQTMSSKGIGLADALFRQLSTKLPNGVTPGEGGLSSIMPPSAPAEKLSMPTLQPGSATNAVEGVKSNPGQPTHVRNFVDRLSSHAEEASRATGIPAKFMLGQAALESGWGKHEIRGANGQSSHNLFGIKATAGWKGKVVEAVTTEYVNGQPQTKVEKFRAYDSYADAFKDYAKLLSKNPRYESVIASAQSVEGFAKGLQRAGYATDPNYANKLTRLIKQTMSA